MQIYSQMTIIGKKSIRMNFENFIDGVTSCSKYFLWRHNFFKKEFYTFGIILLANLINPGLKSLYRKKKSIQIQQAVYSITDTNLVTSFNQFSKSLKLNLKTKFLLVSWINRFSRKMPD